MTQRSQEDINKNGNTSDNTPEFNIPVLDKSDPYKFPARMPSSADGNPRSFDVDDFSRPTARMENWRYVPLEKIDVFIEIFEPSNSLEVTVDSGQKDSGKFSFHESQHNPFLQGMVSKPADRVSVVEWNSVQRFYTIDITQSLSEPVVIDCVGHTFDPDAIHFYIHAHEGVRADIIIRHRGDACLSEGVEIIGDKDSHLRVVSIQDWSSRSIHCASHRMQAGVDGKLRHVVVTLRGQCVRIRSDADFGGKQSLLDMLGVYFVSSGDFAEHRTMITHNHPQCTSRVVYKGALRGQKTKSAWVGNALILPQAAQTDSYELNRNLLLTPGAIADSEPQLEIENGDIIGAGHASSVGRFDEDQLFYLRSRGIPEMAARKLVVRGFFEELVDQIDIPIITDHLMKIVDKRLEETESTDVFTDQECEEKSNKHQ